MSATCWMTTADGKICDKPATGVYRGIGGDQPVCRVHAEALFQRWGIRMRPLTKDES